MSLRPGFQLPRAHPHNPEDTMPVPMHVTRFFFLYCIGMLLLLSRCTGSGSIKDPSQSLVPDELLITGTVVMPDGITTVPGALIRTDPPTEYRKTNDEGFFKFTEVTEAGEYRFIARHPDPEYADLGGLASRIIVDDQPPAPLRIVFRRQEGMDPIPGREKKDVPKRKRGKSGG